MINVGKNISSSGGSNARPTLKPWSKMTAEELLEQHEKMVTRLQDPKFALIDPASVKSGNPMHMAARATLESLEEHMDSLGINYNPSQGRIIPIPNSTIPTPSTMAGASRAPTDQRVFVAGQQASSTTSTTQAKIINHVKDDLVNKTPASTGAPLKGTGKLRSMADDASQAVAAGAKNSGNLKMLGLAAAVGLGAAAYSGMRRTQQDNIDRRLEMQRRGIVS